MVISISNNNKCLTNKLIIILVSLTFFIGNLNYHDEIKHYLQKIFYKEKFFSYREAFKRAQNFIVNILKKELKNEQKFKSSNKPKISAVIPCHNCKNYIEYAVLSIQNQNYSNFEIVIGNDFSSDDSLLFLKQLQKNDSRIKIINNNKNMGTLYTRTISTLFSKGKYIFPIDSDDMFLNFDVFYTVVNIADKGNFDILIFNSIVSDLKPNVYSTKIYTHIYERFHRPNLVLFQPELGYYPIYPKPNFNVKHNEILIFAKCIKSKIYKKAFIKLGKERYSRYMVLGEDDIAIYIIFNTARIAKFIPYYGYFHLNRSGSISSRKQNDLGKLLKNLYILDIVIEFSRNVIENKKILVNYIIYFFRRKNLKALIFANKNNYKTFFSCLDRILNCKYISLENKNQIRSIGKNLKFIKYNF